MVKLEINELTIRGCMLYEKCNKDCYRKTILNNPKWFAPYLSETLVDTKGECEYILTDGNAKKKQDELESLFSTI